jgi:polar amino acid transport system substrate-binding protein
MVNSIFKAFVAVTLVLLGAGAALADTLSLRADNWCPMNCDPKSDKPGYLIEIAKAIFSPAHTIDYQTLNWARAISETRTGAFTAIVGAAKSDAPDFVFPDNELGNSKSCFYAKADSKWSYTGTDSLKAVKLGVTKDYTYGDPFDAYVKTNPGNVEALSGDDVLEKQVKMLLADRTGALIDDSNVVSHYMNANKVAIKEAGCLEATPLYIAFSPKNPKAKEYAKQLSDGVASLRSAGKLQPILDRYGLKDWK